MLVYFLIMIYPPVITIHRKSTKHSSEKDAVSLWEERLLLEVIYFGEWKQGKHRKLEKIKF